MWKRVQCPSDDRPETAKKSAVRREPVPRVTGQQTDEAKVAAILGEQGHGHTVDEACRKQVLRPSARLDHGYRKSRCRHGRLQPVQPQRLDLVVGLGQREVSGQRAGVAIRSDPSMDARLWIPYRDPGGGIRDHPPQATQQSVRSLIDTSRKRRYLCHLRPERHPRAHDRAPSECHAWPVRQRRSRQSALLADQRTSPRAFA